MQTTSLVTNGSKIISQTKRPRQSAVFLYEADGKLNSGVRSPGEWHLGPYPVKALFTCSHELFGPGIEDARLDPFPPTEVTNRDLPSETLQNDADLVFRGVLSEGPSPNLPDENLGLLGRDLCYVGLTGVVLGHFRLLPRCGGSIPFIRSPNTPPLSCFLPLKSVPLSLNASRLHPKRSPKL